MPSLSQRVSSITASATLALNAKAKELQAAGRRIVNLSVGEPDFRTPKVIVDACKKALDDGLFGYSASGGSPILRQKISGKLSRENGLTFDPSQIVVGIGAKELLFHACLALLDKDDEALVFAPYWLSYKSHVEFTGAKCVVVPPYQRDVDFRPKTLKSFLTPKTKLVILNSPSNPAGSIVSKDALLQLGEVLRKHENIWIVSDEIYEYLDFDSPHTSLLNLCPDLRDRFILVNGLSKGFAMTGWRVGYLAAPKNLAQAVANLQSQSSTCLPPFIEKAAEVALDGGRELVKAEVKEIKAKRDLAAELGRGLEKRFKGVRLYKPAGAFYLFVDLNEYLESQRPGMTSLEFCQQLLELQGLAVIPGEPFGAPGCLRMSYATSQERIREGMGLLAEGLASLIS